MIVKCSDLEVTTPCCAECTDKTRVAIYPTNFEGDRPDLGMGIYGLICCKHIHMAQKTPRLWWYERYLRFYNRFTEQEIQHALSAGNYKDYYWRYGEIHAAARLREQSKVSPKLAKIAPIKRVAGRRTNCPECGSNWNDIICENCGHNG